MAWPLAGDWNRKSCAHLAEIISALCIAYNERAACVPLSLNNWPIAGGGTAHYPTPAQLRGLAIRGPEVKEIINGLHIGIGNLADGGPSISRDYYFYDDDPDAPWTSLADLEASVGMGPLAMPPHSLHAPTWIRMMECFNRLLKVKVRKFASSGASYGTHGDWRETYTAGVPPHPTPEAIAAAEASWTAATGGSDHGSVTHSADTPHASSFDAVGAAVDVTFAEGGYLDLDLTGFGGTLLSVIAGFEVVEDNYTGGGSVDVGDLTVALVEAQHELDITHLCAVGSETSVLVKFQTIPLTPPFAHNGDQAHTGEVLARFAQVSGGELGGVAALIDCEPTDQEP